MDRSQRLVLLFLAVFLVTLAPGAEAVKVILEKEMAFNEEGEFLGYLDFEPRVLAALGFETIAEYGYFLAGEVSEEGLVAFQRTAADLELLYQIRRDFDLIQINGYSFSSFGEPTGLPESLTIDEYEGDIGMYLVQFKAPMTSTWWQALKAAGEVVGYIPQNTYIVRADKADLSVLRLVNGVQHVSLYQPAYKVRRSLLTRDEEVEVDVEFDGDQDLDVARTGIRGILDKDVRTDRIGRFAYSRLRATRANRAAILKRPEITWMEPALQIEFSGERGSTIVAGLDDGLTPALDPERFTAPMGHHAWLRSKGFCIPSVNDSGNCIAYWPKVAVIDSGLDTMVCSESGYEWDPVTEEFTGVCTDVIARSRHQDLNHLANKSNNCSGGINQGVSLDPILECNDSTITELFFCSGDDASKHCFVEGTPGKYFFSDNYQDDGLYKGHATAVTSVIAGDPYSFSSEDEDLDPWSSDPTVLAYLVDPEGYYRGVGVAPSARIIVGKLNEYRADSSTSIELATHVHFKDLVASAGKQGARFANNSWNLASGYSDPVYVDEFGYTSFSKIADFLVRHGDGWGGGHQHGMTIVFAAGNWDGIGDDFFVTSPANAKNVITVGATRGWAHDPDSAMAGSSEDDCFFESSGPYTISDVAGFSFGPPFPGWHSRRGFKNETGSSSQMPRVKPDLVAPGSHLSAAYSQFSLTANLYRCFGGTSAAAPFVTGAAVLAEAWYFHKISDTLTKPSPAMIRAMLIANADDLEGATDWADGSSIGHRPVPPQGWGRVNLGNLFQEDVAVVAFDQDDRDYDQYPNGRPDDARRFTDSTQSWSESFAVDVDGPTDVVTIVMVYTDRFSWQGSNPLTVNDLNLQVVKNGLGPYQTRGYWGNNFDSDGFSKVVVKSPAGGPTRNSINTVEMVRLRATDLSGGSFLVQVLPAAISQKAVPGLDGDQDQPNQDFALFIFNAEIYTQE